MNSNQVHRVYLDELGEIRNLPIGMALMLLTTVEEEEAPEEARYLLTRSRQEGVDPNAVRSIMELVTTIMVYRFSQLSHTEVEAMLGLTLQETRVYQEAKAEGEQQGRHDEATNLVLRLLTRRLKQELSEDMRSRVTALPLPTLEELGEALLDFEQLADLVTWLDQHG